MSNIKELLNYGACEWVMPGYKVAKTKHYINKSYSFSPNKDSSRSQTDKEHSKIPDPTKYGETLEQTSKKHWRKASGQFPKGKKKTYLDEIIKVSKSIPGPGSYNKLPKNVITKKNSPMGKFDKSERSTFISTIESYADETPPSWKYSPTRPEKKIYSAWEKPKSLKSKKPTVGPGDYQGLQKAYSKILNNSPNYTFSRSKTPSLYEIKGLKTKGFPGVGAYKESDNAYMKFSLRKQRTPIIMPYKIRRFTETVIENSKNSPGPGSYEIIPSLGKF